MVVEVRLEDIPFSLVYDGFYLSDSFFFVKNVTFSEVICSTMTCLTTNESEANCIRITSMYFMNGQAFKFLQTHVGKQCHVWN